MKDVHSKIVFYLKCCSLIVFFAIFFKGIIESVIQYGDCDIILVQMMCFAHGLIGITCTIVITAFAEFLECYFSKEN